MIKITAHKKILVTHTSSEARRPSYKFQGEAGDGVSFLGEFACVSEHKKDAPLPAVL